MEGTEGEREMDVVRGLACIPKRDVECTCSSNLRRSAAVSRAHAGSGEKQGCRWPSGVRSSESMMPSLTALHRDPCESRMTFSSGDFGMLAFFGREREKGGETWEGGGKQNETDAQKSRVVNDVLGNQREGKGVWESCLAASFEDEQACALPSCADQQGGRGGGGGRKKVKKPRGF